MVVTRPANSRMQVTFPDGAQGGTLNPLVEVKPYEALKQLKYLDSNSHLIFDVFHPVFLLTIIAVATNYPTG